MPSFGTMSAWPCSSDDGFRDDEPTAEVEIGAHLLRGHVQVGQEQVEDRAATHREPTLMATYFSSRYSSMPVLPPSRPTPDCFTPPNGALGSDT